MTEDARRGPGAPARFRQMMTPPDICLHCHTRIRPLLGGTWTHALTRTIHCRAGDSHKIATPDVDWYRDQEWEAWLETPPAARTPGRGGALHVVAFAMPGVALCGPDLAAATTQAPSCRECLNRHSDTDYRWRYERHWKKPYGGRPAYPGDIYGGAYRG